MVEDKHSLPRSAVGNALPSASDDAEQAEAPETKRVLTPAAQRALAEAAQRRAAAEEVAMEKELGGRKEGPEPTRYGDWESKGLISDF